MPNAVPAGNIFIKKSDGDAKNLKVKSHKATLN